jgi:hypothetical protein
MMMKRMTTMMTMMTTTTMMMMMMMTRLISIEQMVDLFCCLEYYQKEAKRN